jgi:hypothetical protein
MNSPVARNLGWAVLANGIVGAIGALLLVLLFVVGEPFGTLNDITSLPWCLALMLFALLYYQYAGDRRPLHLVTVSAALLGLAALFVLQLLLILKLITIWQQGPYITAAYGLIGLWMVIIGASVRRQGDVPPALGTLGILIGFMWLAAMVLVYAGGFPAAEGVSSITDMPHVDMLTLVGYVFIFLGYFVEPVWAIWLGGVLLAA